MVLERRHRLILAAIVLLGLGLRVAAARGGLWLDEAWSVVHAREAGTPLAVLFGINHDNNHHLNTWWLQLVGAKAPPLLQRTLSIVSGTAAVLLAAWLGARCNPGAALATALLFAISPILVNYGSEARGYAPMLLALLAALLIVERWLDRPDARLPGAGLGAIVLLGMLAQLTFLFGLAAIAGWVVLRLWQARALRLAPRVLAPLLLPAAAVLALVFVAAHASPHGFRMGSYDAFSLPAFGKAMHDLSAALLGATPISLVAGAAAALALVFAPRSPRAGFYALAIFGLPIAVCLFQMPNTGFGRYYLVSAVALLLLLGDLAGRAKGRWPIVALAALLAATGFSLAADLALIREGRGTPEAALQTIAARHPAGASIAYADPRGSAVIEVLAGQARYPLRSRQSPCPPPDYVYLDAAPGAAAAPPIEFCGARYHPVAQGRAQGLSGMNWTLLARAH